MVVDFQLISPDLLFIETKLPLPIKFLMHHKLRTFLVQAIDQKFNMQTCQVWLGILIQRNDVS